MTAGWLKSLTIINIIVVILLTGIVHLRFEKWSLTVLAFIGGLIVLSLSLGYITPKEAIDNLKDKVLQKEKS
jgi:Na+/H+ antiporter NhaD/arsenite permease-like protein